MLGKSFGVPQLDDRIQSYRMSEHLTTLANTCASAKRIIAILELSLGQARLMLLLLPKVLPAGKTRTEQIRGYFRSKCSSRCIRKIAQECDELGEGIT